jgi:hypothetical protein
MLRMRRSCSITAILLSAALAAPAARAEPAASGLALEAIEIEPAAATPSTLCHLRVRIRNGGDRVASSFAFRVELDGRELAAYRNQVFLDPIEPGETRSLRLHSFWTGDAGSPGPEGGRIVVEVTLLDARWMKVERAADGASVWTETGAVEGLPLAARRTLEPKR